jgi:hypothetical protein
MRLLKVLIVLGLVAGVLLVPATALAAFGIDPGKVYIDNLHPGAQAEFHITIYNQNDYETTFVVTAREPDYTDEDEGYDALPYLDWVTVTPDRVIIGANDEGEVLITVAMPEDADYSGKKSEVWISFMEEGTEGMIKIELCSRIFIATRVETGSEPPATTGEGGVGITVDGEKGEPDSPSSLWAIIGAVLGALIGGGIVFFLVKRRRHA